MKIELSTRNHTFSIGASRSKIKLSPQGSSRKVRRFINGQLREYGDSPFAGMYGNEFRTGIAIDLIDSLRSNIPILDVIPTKLIRLMGDIHFDTGGKEHLQKALETFYEKVPVDQVGHGIPLFQNQILDSAIARGRGYGATVMNKPASLGINRLQVGDAKYYTFVKDKNGRLIIAEKENQYSLTPKPLRDQDSVYYLALDLRNGNPSGYSIYHSLPFVAQILLRLFKNIDNTAWRIGDPMFYVGFDNPETLKDYDMEEIMNSVQAQWEEAYKDKRQGIPGDIFGPAKLHVGIVGGAKDSIIEALEFPMKVIIEQMAAKSGLPAWMFGSHWASRETLAKHENDMIVANIKWMRRMLNPILDRIFSTYLFSIGMAGQQWKFEWGDVNLLDEAEQAKARNLNATAKLKEIQAILLLMENKLVSSRDEAESILRRQGIIDSNKVITAEWWTEREKEFAAVRISKMLNAA